MYTDLDAPAFRLGDKQVLRLLAELDSIKGQELKPGTRARRSDALIHSCRGLLKEHLFDPLLGATALWVLLCLLRLDPAQTGSRPGGVRAALAEAGVPGLLSEVLQAPGISKVTREYAGELTTALWYV
jgi:hypothetical protein